MRSLTRVKEVVVPNTLELNAILFDLQNERSNIVNVQFIGETMAGMSYLIVYHMQDHKPDEIEDEINTEEITEPSSEDLGSSI